MNLAKKKILAAKTLGVGKERIVFNVLRLADIKEAITKQDIRGLIQDKAILIAEVGGRKKVVHKKTRRRAGSIRKHTRRSKTTYIHLTRKLRGYLAELRKKNKLPPTQYRQLRREIRASMFKSKAHMKERMVQT